MANVGVASDERFDNRVTFVDLFIDNVSHEDSRVVFNVKGAYLCSSQLVNLFVRPRFLGS